MARERMIICFVIVIAAIFLCFFQDAVAMTNFAEEHEAAIQEESTEVIHAPPSRNEAVCGSPSKRSPARAAGKCINGFFAFGCRVNYRLTDWILSDKCDTNELRCNNPLNKRLSE